LLNVGVPAGTLASAAAANAAVSNSTAKESILPIGRTALSCLSLFIGPPQCPFGYRQAFLPALIRFHTAPPFRATLATSVNFKVMAKLQFRKVRAAKDAGTKAALGKVTQRLANK
jgi:hypothetical protein